ncbi:GbsR/MarR family transcriptional regulator [Paenibacillus sp. J2TS4]|uniref:GbsR/MarR family transcriptional regulator n=1 Tax=Paenibacillus sp. J2TS4 TaxID=2807194 RepID=UPI001B1F241F|nr:GbsR/MarR family transcriptional regulator [Paenibacillus sp. J2TS4]GIP33211.1 HTH-type transcriptional repressor OpcR [Paenibacillus sp. J2TS4]
MNQWNQLTDEQASIIQKARERVIESIGNNMDLYGITLSTGHLYGMMFFQDKPMTLDEMGQQMGMSKTTMSTGVRTLHDLKMVKKVWGKGSRKDLYEVEQDWYQNFADYFVIKWRHSLEMNLQVLKKSIHELKQLLAKDPGHPQLNEIIHHDIHKMEEAINYYLWLDRLIDTFESGQIYDLVPKQLPAPEAAD